MANYTDMPEYYPPQVTWKEKWAGRTWEEMCGNDEVDKKLNFFLYRRGLFKEDSDCLNAVESDEADS